MIAARKCRFWRRISTRKFPRQEKRHRSDLWLSERLASLGIMAAQLRAPLKPPVHHSTIILRGLRGYLTWVPKEMEIF